MLENIVWFIFRNLYCLLLIKNSYFLILLLPSFLAMCFVCQAYMFPIVRLFVCISVLSVFFMFYGPFKDRHLGLFKALLGVQQHQLHVLKVRQPTLIRLIIKIRWFRVNYYKNQKFILWIVVLKRKSIMLRKCYKGFTTIHSISLMYKRIFTFNFW